jgi:NADH-quinone oxidoreductase subunit F
MRFLLGYGSCGIAAGAKEVKQAFDEIFSNTPYEVEQVGCNGLCFAEPLVQVIFDDNSSVYYGRLNYQKTLKMLREILDGKKPEDDRIIGDELAFYTRQTRIVLRNCGAIDPESIDAYESVGGYAAYRKALNKTPEWVIDEIKQSGLRGRGGAGFPTWMKWNAAKNAAGETKYIVCNADEGDPGAFMDRSALEGDPHNVIEGMMIAGYAVGAAEGIIYVRAEYPMAVRRLELAISAATEKGYLGSNILGSGFNYSMRILKGAGAFVCGEETALLASLEGQRGMPRSKPPFPAQSGYNGKPTNINNVETFANVPWIIDNGGAAFAAMGTDDSKGTKVFALAGKVKRGGLVEIAMGATLRQVIFDIGGGIINDIPIKAVQMGGPSGGCLPASLLDTVIDYKSIGETGAIMGSGGMVVMDESTCMVDMARYFSDFTAKESCGKCIACRIGTTRMRETLERITAGNGDNDDLKLLPAIANTLKDSAMCGLGNTSPNPVLTTLRYFPEEYEKHILEKRCPALSCRAMISFDILPDTCKGCGLCFKHCPVNAISGELRKPYIIDKEKCICCGECKTRCRFNAVTVISGKGA